MRLRAEVSSQPTPTSHQHSTAWLIFSANLERRSQPGPRGPPAITSVSPRIRASRGHHNMEGGVCGRSSGTRWPMHRGSGFWGSDRVKLNFVQGVVSSLATSLASARVRFENGDGLADMGIRMPSMSCSGLPMMQTVFNFTVYNISALLTSQACSILQCGAQCCLAQGQEPSPQRIYICTKSACVKCPVGPSHSGTQLNFWNAVHSRLALSVSTQYG